MKTRAIYELISVNKNTKELTRGGLRLTYETALKYCAINNQNDPDNEYTIVIANENAITLRDYYKQLKSVN